MKEKINEIVADYLEDYKEWGSTTFWINENIDNKNFDKKDIVNLVNELFVGLDKKGILSESFLEIIVHDVNARRGTNIEINDFMYNNYKIEGIVNNNSEISRLFIKALKSKKGFKVVDIDSLVGKTYGIIMGKFLHIYIYPEKNKLFFVDEWLHGKNIDFVIEKNLHKN